MRRRAIPKGLSQMQRVTITLDDDLLETLDNLSQRRGYNNRSEAIRDILRGALAQEATQEHGTQGFAVLSYVYEHEKRDLASRIVSTQHHHHDLSVATLHVVGVTYRLIIDPSSFSRTTLRALSIDGIIMSSSGMTAGTIAGRLFTSGL